MKILIVDDELITRQWLVMTLRNLGDMYQVCAEAKNGKEAYCMAKEQSPDVIITDIKMPLMSGIEMIEKLRNEEIEVQVILLTAYSDFEYARQAMRKDVIEYILKAEITEEVLLSALRKVQSELDKKAVHNEEILDLSQISYNQCQQIVGYQKIKDYSASIGQACKYIHKNFSESISLQLIADIVYLNRTYFSELFKKETGVNFVEYLNCIRIVKAAELLKKEDISLIKAAVSVGFANVPYFIKVFKKYMGNTPSDYKKNRI